MTFMLLGISVVLNFARTEKNTSLTLFIYIDILFVYEYMHIKYIHILGIYIYTHTYPHLFPEESLCWLRPCRTLSRGREGICVCMGAKNE